MDFDERDGDFDEGINDVKKDHKMCMNQIIEDFKIQLISKTKLGIPLRCMISMLIVRPTLLVDVKKMEHSFQMGYKKGENLLCLYHNKTKEYKKWSL
jgi:hypothetical protein